MGVNMERISGLIITFDYAIIRGMANKFRVKRILVLLHFGGASGRDILSGILDAIKPGMHWHTRILSGADFGDAERLLDGIDGVITSERGSATFRAALEKARVPTVVIGQAEEDFSSHAAPMAFVHNNDTSIGQKACRYFLSLGDFRSFVFLPATCGTRWSEQRKAGFLETLADAGRVCNVVRMEDVDECEHDNALILNTIRKAEKPCAVFAAWDGRAAQTLTICAENGIDVPGQVAVLGVDNDELICDHSSPPLSSIKPNHHKVGMAAASELKRMFKSSGRSRRVLHIPCKTTVERESTRPLPPMAGLVRRAMRLVAERAAQGLTPADAASALGVSRRLLDMRLRQAENATLYKVISHARLDAMARELRKSRLSIRTIAKKLGYGDIKRLERQFKERFKMTMGEWRSRRKRGESTLRN